MSENSYEGDIPGARRLLQAYQEWINIHDSEVYLHGPFNFAHNQGRQTKDRISESDWRTMYSIQCNIDNHLPPQQNTLCGYICHLDTPYHSEYESKSISATINAVLLQRYFK